MDTKRSGWDLFYKIFSVAILLVGLICLVAGLLSLYGPNEFLNNVEVFPIEQYQIGYGIAAIIFYTISIFILKAKIIKVLWWILLTPIILGLSLAIVTDPFNIQKSIGSYKMRQKPIESHLSRTKKLPNGDYILETWTEIRMPDGQIIIKDRTETTKSADGIKE